MNKIVLQKIMVSVLCGVFCVTAFGMEQQVLELCIHIDLNQAFRRPNAEQGDLERYGMFGLKDMTPPFENYFLATFVEYRDVLDDHGCVEIVRNLRKDIPTVIEKHFKKSVKFNQKKYLFPKYVSQSFIEKVRDGEFKQVAMVYDHEENKQLMLRYAIKEGQKKEQITPAPVSSTVQSMASTSSLLDYLHTITEALCGLAVMR